MKDLTIDRSKVLELRLQRTTSEYSMLLSCLDVFLSCTYELQLYALQLECCPNAFAVLGAPTLQESTRRMMKERLLSEWHTVLAFESQKEEADVIHGLCPYTKHQCYRDLATALELSSINSGDSSFEDDLVALVKCYFPAFASSANVEQLFQQMQDACNRSCKPDNGSMANLMSVSVRAMHRRLCVDPDVEPVQLDASDWEGRATRGLKPKLWTPSSAAPSPWIQIS